MKTQQEITELAFKIITHAGSAKSLALEALASAKNEKNYSKAASLLDQAHKEYVKATHIHVPLIQEEAGGTKIPFFLILMHAEDILLTTETLILLITEIVELYKVSKNVE